jgi:lysophospholipase L1-like esterase
MTSATRVRLGFLGVLGVCLMMIGCDSGDGSHSTPNDVGAPATGGSGGNTSSTGGASAVGGTMGMGGGAGTGGATGSGGTTGSGGRTGNGGRSGTGGAPGTGGTATSGGATSNGGGPGNGGSSGSRDSGAAPETGPAPEAGTDTGGTPGVLLEGRFDRTDASKPSFGWSGSAMIARFQGTGATLRIDGSPNQFTVVVDGNVSSKVLKVVSGTTQYSLAAGLSSAVHDVVIWRRTEGNQGESRFLGIDAAGGQLQAPPALPDRRIEIYGDSITAGYGLDGVGPSCPWSPDTENHYLTYGAITARELGADLHTIAWSGIGMYRNYGVSGASSDAMPYVYARTLPSQAASVWDFKTWQPHAVVINLGTNDASTNGDPGAPYKNAYLEFVRALRQKYPDTFFVLTIGPMLDGASLTAVKGHIQSVITTRASEGDSKMSFLEFPVQVEADGYGCDWHPSAKTNAKMATLLVAELKARLGW